MGNDYNANSMVSSPEPVVKSAKEVSAYDELMKEALYNNFIKIANKLRLDQKSKNTGANFIQSIIDKSTDEVNKSHFKALNANSEETSVIEYTYASIMEDYSKELRSVNYELMVFKVLERILLLLLMKVLLINLMILLANLLHLRLMILSQIE